MTKRSLQQLLKLGVLLSATFCVLSTSAYLKGRDSNRQNSQESTTLPSGQNISPTAINDSVQQFFNPGLANYPSFIAGEAVRSRLSPDGSTLAVLTAGQNSLYKSDGTLDTANSKQFLFLYNVEGTNSGVPALVQVIQQLNAHVGLVFSADGKTIYTAGGSDDVVYVYTKSGGTFTAGTPIPLGHSKKGIGIGVEPNAGGLDISADGKTLVVANNYNDSISVIDLTTSKVLYEHDLRPFFSGNEGAPGGPGGTFPYAVVMKGSDTAYVSSDRDREVDVIGLSPTAGKLLKRIKLDGNALGMTLDQSQSKLYVAEDNADQVAVIDTATNTVVSKIDARAPSGMLPGVKYTGAATSAVTLSPDGDTLYAVNSGSNSIAVIPLSGGNALSVKGLIPTAYEPHDVTFSADGLRMYIINGKSVTGPNDDHLASATASLSKFTYPEGNTAAAAAARASNQYQFQLERASLVSALVPNSGDLKGLTDKVAKNNFYSTAIAKADGEVMQFLSGHIKHVIYIVKENRTFDQLLGDLTNGADADPNLTVFGQAITPNYHKLSSMFVTLDNFNNPGDGSMDGWSWVLQARVTNTEALTQQINYAFIDRGLSYESEGSNRNVPVNLGTVSERDAAAGPAGTTNYSTASASLPGGTANLLTGTGNHASTDAPFGTEAGYIFNAVLKAGKTVRNYGFHVNNIGKICVAGTPSPCAAGDTPVSQPFAQGIIQVAPLDPSLVALTDVYFRGFDMNYPDLWRYDEWKREFDQYVTNGNLPSLTQMRISHDHMGSFATALAGVTTPEAQQADCDLALGLLVEAVAHSRDADDTLIIVTEDDVQDGPDHVDSHRGPAFVVGPYVKHGRVISTRYSQVNVLRTIEDLLGTEHLNLNTAFQRPMTELFDIHSSGKWTYDSETSTVIGSTMLASAKKDTGLRYAKGPVVTPKHDAAYWAAVTAGFDFSDADRVPPARFNKVLWAGLMGGKPYPTLVNQGSGVKDSD